MGVVNGLSKARMLAIEAASIVSGFVNGTGQLVLESHDGSQIFAGHVKGDKGDKGDLEDLPDRLKTVETTTNWNNALEFGTYVSTDAANSPMGFRGPWSGFVETNGSFVSQVLHLGGGGLHKSFSRSSPDNGATWSQWVPEDVLPWAIGVCAYQQDASSTTSPRAITPPWSKLEMGGGISHTTDGFVMPYGGLVRLKFRWDAEFAAAAPMNTATFIYKNGELVRVADRSLDTLVSSRTFSQETVDLIRVLPGDTLIPGWRVQNTSASGKLRSYPGGTVVELEYHSIDKYPGAGSLQLVHIDGDPDDTATPSFSNVDLGLPATNRTVIVMAMAGAGVADNIDSISINGVSGIQDTKILDEGSYRIFLARAVVPTGRTGDIDITFSGVSNRTNIFVYTYYGNVVLVDSDGIHQPSGTSTEKSVTGVSSIDGGFALFGATARSGFYGFNVSGSFDTVEGQHMTVDTVDLLTGAGSMVTDGSLVSATVNCPDSNGEGGVLVATYREV